ncbi:putative acetyltransferase [compost metagenome]
MFPPSQLASFRTIRLSLADAPRLQPLLEACEDYFLMITGEGAGPQEAESELASLPPGKTLDEKFFIGLQKPEGNLVGVLDVVKDYPEPGIWYLGLLLLHPRERAKGLGASLHAQLCENLREHGGRAIRLGVLEQNEKALRFWERMGYRELERKPFKAGSLPHTVRVLQRGLEPEKAKGPPLSGGPG